jgi:hypothetical protein
MWWLKREDALLGTSSDADVARMLGRTIGAIRQRRFVLRRKPFRGGKPQRRAQRAWTAAEDRKLGTDTDKAIGALIDRDPVCVQTRRKVLGIPAFEGNHWTAEEDAALGTAEDKEIAKRLGRTTVAVLARRRILGIMAFGRSEWTPGELALLGTRPDSEIAKVIGRAESTVRSKRKSMGRASFTEAAERVRKRSVRKKRAG